jgi:site-specific DNA-methyltransferase (adenine-specific)
MFIPNLENYDIQYSDEILRKKWEITDDEWNFIDSKIKNIGVNEIVGDND